MSTRQNEDDKQSISEEHASPTEINSRLFKTLQGKNAT